MSTFLVKVNSFFSEKSTLTKVLLLYYVNINRKEEVLDL